MVKKIIQYNPISSDDLIKLVGKDLLSDLFNWYYIKQRNSKFTEEIKKLLIKNNIISRGTRWVWIYSYEKRNMSIHNMEDYNTINVKNGNGKEVLHITWTINQERELFDKLLIKE